ncbi:MAG: response regulator transcription factor [Acidimicrobiia bacterium]|nr:response regulator transcription factor [Acidimicrobiia bacterium]
MIKQTRVMIVDDEPTIREVMTTYLQRDGFLVDTAATGAEAVAKLRKGLPDLLILDLMLPGVGGLNILKELRTNSTVPVIVLTARTEEADRIIGLELGADDYVSKPFSPRELVARVRSVLRRVNVEPEPGVEVLEFDGLTIDTVSREVTVNGELATLTAREFDLLVFLASSPRQVFSRSQLLDHVWHSSSEWQDTSTVTVHVRRIRHKIEQDPERPDRLVTVRGVGYRFEG